MRYIPISILFFLIVTTTTARAEEATETWDRVHMAGAHVGYQHGTRSEAGEGDSRRIETTQASEFSMRRLGTPMEITASSTTWETLDGNLLRIEVETKMSAQTSKAVYTFEGGKVKVARTVMGQTRVVEQDVPTDIAGPAKLERLMKALAGTTGETLEIISFMPDLEQVVNTTITSKGVESVSFPDGTQREFTRLETAIKTQDGKPTGMSPIAWIDTDGGTQKSELRTAGLLIESYRVASEAAAKVDDAATNTPAPDLMVATLLSEADPIPVPRRLDGARILVRPKEAGVTLPDVSSVAHDVLVREDGTLDVYARRAVPRPGRTGVRPIENAPAALTDALGPSSMIQADAEAIRKIAQDVVGDESDAWAAAQRLESWVFEHVTKKSMGVAFASALEVCESREGDCTEHAVLLAALGRAAGIPTRVVMGLTFLYGVWGGHAWNEVYIEGEWYPLDATNGLGFVDPLHLPMAHMTMKDGASSEFIAIMQGMGNLTLDIVGVERGGTWIDVGDSSLVSTTDGRYRNEVLGIAFAVPNGLEIDPAPRKGGLDPKLLELEGEAHGLEKVDIDITLLDAPPGDGWTWLLKQGMPDPAAVEAIAVDGRPARRVMEQRGGKKRSRVAVIYDGALWLFTLKDADAEGGQKAFEALLESVDFDVR